MNYYQEITIIENSEISKYFIWTKLFTQVHLSIAEAGKLYGSLNIGVSFPGYKYLKDDSEIITTLGIKLRVFAKSEADLEKLDLNKWLARLLDYVHITSVKKVNNPVGYLIVKRYRMELDRDRKLNNLAKKKGVSLEEKRLECIKYYANKFNLTEEQAIESYNSPNFENKPYIKMKSLESKKSFSLFIDQQKVESSSEGTFNSYGLSSVATVPDF